MIPRAPGGAFTAPTVFATLKTVRYCRRDELQDMIPSESSNASVPREMS
jgi:hypothetical protein